VSIRADDFYLVPDPIGRQINPAAVAARFYPLFDHFLTVYFEFDPVVGNISGKFPLIGSILIGILIFVIWHLGLPLSWEKLKNRYGRVLEQNLI
jgi:hypothetical protein